MVVEVVEVVDFSFCVMYGVFDVIFFGLYLFGVDVWVQDQVEIVLVYDLFFYSVVVGVVMW